MSHSLQGKRILLVDDDAGDIELIRHCLMEAVNDLSSLMIAANLKEALHKIRSSEPDVILLDLELPDAKEMYALHAISALSPNASIIIMTGNNDDLFVENALQSGAHDYLLKDALSSHLLTHSLKFALDRAEFTNERQRLHEELNSITSTVPGVVYRFRAEIDGQWSLPYVSSKLEDLFGFRADEKTDVLETIIDLVTDNDRADTISSIKETVQNKQDWDYTFHIEHPVKGLRTLNALSQYNGIDASGAGIWTGFIVDRTVEEQQKTELRKLSWVVSNSSVAMVIADNDGTIQWVNKSYETITGYNKDQLIGRKPGHLLQGPESKPETIRYMSQQLKAGKGFDVETINYRGGKEPYWASTTVVPAVAKNGRVEYYFGLQRDITKQRKSNIELDRQRLLLERAATISGVGAWDFDVATQQSSWSAQTRRIHEVEDDFQPNFENGVEFYTEEGQRLIQDAMQNAIEKGIAFHLETEMTTAKGNRISVEVTGDPWQENGKTKTVTGVIRDITETRLRAEQLKRAKETAEKANLAKTEFLATMSHEIRTPLNAIVGFGELLEENIENEDREQYIRLINESGLILTELVNEILDFSKIEAGDINLSPKEQNIVEWLDGIMAHFKHSTESKGLGLEWSVAPEAAGNWFFDGYRLKQVIVNLLRNAVKFTEQGRIDVAIKLFKDQTVGITVSDTGIGIAADKLETIFKPFEQVDSSYTRKYGGTGLGLAMCRRIVELMGGEICAESTPTCGTTFHIQLPLQRPYPESIHAPINSGNASLRKHNEARSQ
jgi:PAS domain S-box-containing protein